MATNKVNINIPIPQVEIHMEGNWQKVVNLGNGLTSSVIRGYEKGLYKFSRKLLLIVRRSLKSGTPPPGSGVYWKPLSPNTIRSHGYHKLYNLTGLYSRSIGIQKHNKRTYIGIPRNIKPSNKHASKTLNQVAILLEFGSRNGKIPARPLWKPSFQSADGNGNLKKDLLWGIRSQLYSDYGINARRIR